MVTRRLFWSSHDDVIKWKHFPRYWTSVRGTHRSPVNSPHKGQWRRALVFSLICAWTNFWVNTRDAGDLRCYRSHNDVTVMIFRVAKQHKMILEWEHKHCIMTGHALSYEHKNGDKEDDPLTSIQCLTHSLCSRFLNALRNASIFDTTPRKVISNSLDIDFIQGHIYSRS